MKKLSANELLEINGGVKKVSKKCAIAAATGIVSGAIAGATSGALAGPFGVGGGAFIGGMAGWGGSMIQEPSCNK
ncbi:TPA: Blp family class II bacteriocin [Staphylococcus aureus]